MKKDILTINNTPDWQELKHVILSYNQGIACFSHCDDGDWENIYHMLTEAGDYLTVEGGLQPCEVWNNFAVRSKAKTVIDRSSDGGCDTVEGVFDVLMEDDAEDGNVYLIRMYLWMRDKEGYTPTLPNEPLPADTAAAITEATAITLLNFDKKKHKPADIDKWQRSLHANQDDFIDGAAFKRWILLSDTARALFGDLHDACWDAARLSIFDEQEDDYFSHWQCVKKIVKFVKRDRFQVSYKMGSRC